ncbi:MAG: cell division protein FtsQ/DivIB [Clostridia bacterium]
MTKKNKGNQMNLYYMNNGQAERETMGEDASKKKKAKEREKRIREGKQLKKEDVFDLETETVIQMTNKNKIKKEEQRRKELTKQERKRKKRNRRIKFFLKLILFIGLISGAIIFALTSPIFNIKNINVINNSEVASDTVISLSGLKQEENIFRFYKGSVVNKIKENSYIENVKIRRKFPNTIEIEVEERVAKYSVDYMGKYAYINTQGYILEISEDSRGLPIIQGITTKEEEVVPGNRLNNEDLSRLEDAIKIMNSASENGLDRKVTSIDISDKDEYSIYLEEEKKKVHLGDVTNLSNKMLYVVAIMEQESGKEGDIYVNGDLNNKFQPYFREKL